MRSSGGSWTSSSCCLPRSSSRLSRLWCSSGHSFTTRPRLSRCPCWTAFLSASTSRATYWLQPSLCAHSCCRHIGISAPTWSASSASSMLSSRCPWRTTASWCSSNWPRRRARSYPGSASACAWWPCRSSAPWRCWCAAPCSWPAACRSSSRRPTKSRSCCAWAASGFPQSPRSCCSTRSTARRRKAPRTPWTTPRTPRLHSSTTTPSRLRGRAPRA
mmetsp:Transcript_41224/g.106669  ORF Transcript_41224/g.106669 Transcript_41224/m.106669 type:complete len:217 (+) Transcript_41224:247-897(+)